MVVQFVPSAEVWTENARAYAVSQFSVTWSMVAVAPRSTRSHWGSLNALDHRVPGLPSVAAAAGVPPFSAEDAVVGRPWDSSAPAAPAGAATTTPAPRDSAARAATEPRTARVRLRGRGRRRRRDVAGMRALLLCDVDATH